MPQLEIMISFRGMKQNLGLLEPNCTVAKIKEANVNIMSPYGLNFA